MRKSYFIFALVLSSSVLRLHAYTGLVNEEATWKETIYGWVTSYWTYKFDGDTIINGQVYKKLYSEDEMFPGQWIYGGALRDDLENQKVFRTFGSEEHLLYDFSLEAGQSATIYPAGYPYEVTVSSTGTVMVNGEMRKAIYFNMQWYTEVWIEGVGSMQGVDTPFIIEVMADWAPSLTCYYWGNDLAYDNPNEDTLCDEFLAIEEQDQPGLLFYPNPAIEYFRLELPVGVHEATLKIINGAGSCVMEQFIDRNAVLEVSQLSPGFYIICLDDQSGGTWYGRLSKE